MQVLETYLVDFLEGVNAHADVDDDSFLNSSCKHPRRNGEFCTGPFYGLTGLAFLVCQLAVQGFPYKSYGSYDRASPDACALNGRNRVVGEAL